MKQNKNCVNAIKIGRLVNHGKSLADKRELVRCWANEMRLAIRAGVAHG